LFAAFTIVRLDLALFKVLESSGERSIEKNKEVFGARLAETLDRERLLFREKRIAELSKRNLAFTEEMMKSLDEAKLKLTLLTVPDKLCSSFNERVLTRQEVVSLIGDKLVSFPKAIVYADMHSRGFYISSGMKFGGDFLAYAGDPVLYHAQFALKLLEPTSGGRIDLTKVDYNDLNAFQRLTHTANKIPLFVTVELKCDTIHSLIDDNSYNLTYWTLKERQYLNADSDVSDFKLIDPNPRHTCKIIRTA